MADFTYYCEVFTDKRFIKKGIYTYSCGKRKDFKYLELIQHSDKIWRQGPKGGVSIAKDRNSRLRHNQYITSDEKIMKEFMWIKLKAQAFTQGK